LCFVYYSQEGVDSSGTCVEQCPAGMEEVYNFKEGRERRKRGGIELEYLWFF
jgi:hypothetical protein